MLGVFQSLCKQFLLRRSKLEFDLRHLPLDTVDAALHELTFVRIRLTYFAGSAGEKLVNFWWSVKKNATRSASDFQVFFAPSPARERRYAAPTAASSF
jgi:hypothetical protein